MDASKTGNISHQAICSGWGRFSTCRIKIISDKNKLNKPNVNEIKAIERAGLDDGIRLACQLRPTNDISVIPLLNPNTSIQNLKYLLNLTGKEQETVIVFVDLRDFTKLSETALPYDVLYILNKYYAACGEVVEKTMLG